MKQITLAGILLFFTWQIQSQDLYVGSGSFVTVQTNASLYINGLMLVPDSNYTITANTQVERFSSPVNTGNISILAHHDISPAFTNFSGQLQFGYQESELNGIAETDLSLALLDINSNWQGYGAVLDTNLNTLSYIFDTAANFSKVTADFNATLNGNSQEITASLTVYPNPTSSYVYIKYAYPVKTTLYNMLGQVLQRGTAHQVDLSLYEEATYLLNVQDQNSKASKLFKIIKK